MSDDLAFDVNAAIDEAVEAFDHAIEALRARPFSNKGLLSEMQTAFHRMSGLARLTGTLADSAPLGPIASQTLLRLVK